MAGQVATGGGKKKRRCERVRVQSGEDQSSVRALYSEDGRCEQEECNYQSAIPHL